MDAFICLTNNKFSGMLRVKTAAFLFGLEPLAISIFVGFCRKMQKKQHLLTFNTENVEICANVKNIAHY